MTSAQVESLTTAFDFAPLLSTFILLAPYILGVAGVVLAVALIKWGVKVIRRRLSSGVA